MMRITLEPTEHMFHTDESLLVRAWKGTDETGAHVVAFITAIAVTGDRKVPDLMPLDGPGLPFLPR